jgi:hypothetical protein
LEEAGFDVGGYSFFSLSTPPRCDFTLGSRAFDCKAVRPDSSFATVNETKRKNCIEFEVDFVFVRFDCSNTATVLRPVSARTAGDWELRRGHSFYRSTYVWTLKPLRDWKVLLEGGEPR